MFFFFLLLVGLSYVGATSKPKFNFTCPEGYYRVHCLIGPCPCEKEWKAETKSAASVSVKPTWTLPAQPFHFPSSCVCFRSPCPCEQRARCPAGHYYGYGGICLKLDDCPRGYKPLANECAEVTDEPKPTEPTTTTVPAISLQTTTRSPLRVDICPEGSQPMLCIYPPCGCERDPCPAGYKHSWTGVGVECVKVANEPKTAKPASTTLPATTQRATTRSPLIFRPERCPAGWQPIPCINPPCRCEPIPCPEGHMRTLLGQCVKLPDCPAGYTPERGLDLCNKVADEPKPTTPSSITRSKCRRGFIFNPKTGECKFDYRSCTLQCKHPPCRCF